MAGIYCADIYCSDCIEDIKDRIATELFNGDDNSCMKEFIDDADYPGFMEVSDFRNQLDSLAEGYYDSEQYPKHCGDDEESDSPQHCGSGENCLNPSETSDGEKYGYFFENNLTADGDEYVKETVNENLRDGRTDSPAVELWKPCYDYIEYHEKCECGAYGDLDEDDKCDDCVDRPEEGDYTITPCGSLGGMSGVGVIEGKFIGEFHSDAEAITAIRRIMDEEKFWPNIWIVSDHGNWTLHVEDDNNDN